MEPSPRRRSLLAVLKARENLICLVMLLLVLLALWLPRLRGPINYRWDASTYYVLGTALAEGKGYRLLNEPGEIHAVQYPPLLPMLVAAAERIMGTSDYFKVGSALRLIYLVLSALFLFMTYTLAREFFPPRSALVIGIITALSFSSFLGPSDVLYADLPFALVLLAFLYTHQRNNRPFCAALSGILAAAAYLLRTAGLALFVAWVAESVFRRRFRQTAVRAAISALPIVLWQGYVWKVTHSYEYHHPAYSYQRAAYNYANVTYSENTSLVDPFRPELGYLRGNDLLKRLVRNVATVPVALGESAVFPKWFVPSLVRQARALGIPFSRQWQPLFSAGLFTVGLLALAGGVLVASGERWFLSLYFAISLALIIITPWDNQFWRYLAPMAPLTLIFVLVALFSIKAWISRLEFEWGRASGIFIVTIPLAAILVTQIAVAVHLFRSRSPVTYYDATGRARVFHLLDYGSEWHALDPAFEWVRQHVPAKSVVATSVPHLAYLRAAHKAVLPPLEVNSDVASRVLDEVPVSYLVVDRFGRPGISEHYVAPLLAARPADWHLVFTAPDGRTCVYERAQ
jgi:hypothetical protein